MIALFGLSLFFGCLMVPGAILEARVKDREFFRAFAMTFFGLALIFGISFWLS